MTALDLPNREAGTRRGAGSLSGRWSLAAGGTAQTRPRSRGWTLRTLIPGTPRTGTAIPRALVRRRHLQTLPLVSGALIVGDPVHLTVGEVAIAVDKTHAVRLTLAEVTALGNRRFAAELIASALGEDAGPDETLRFEGHAERSGGGALRVVLTGPAPAGLGGPGRRLRISAAFVR